MPNVDGCDMHVMLHPSNAVYDTPENEVPYIVKAFSTIVHKGEAYREAFADPHYVMEGQESIAKIATTKVGDGNIYNNL